MYKIAEQKFGSFQKCSKVRTAKAERKTLDGLFFVSPMVKPVWMCTIVYQAFWRPCQDILYDKLMSGIPKVAHEKNSHLLHDVTPPIDWNPHDDNTPSTSSSKQQERYHDHEYHDDMEHMNVFLVCHGLTFSNCC
jgi:hypothetical protein